MSANATAVRAQRPKASARTLLGGLRITRRGIQIALGCIWLLDGFLQFQSFMYSHEFIATIIEPTAHGQPGFISHPILTFAHFYQHNFTLWNTLSGEIQVAIGLGLIASRKTVRPALFASYVWASFVWWFGEGFGTILSGAPVSPLMGAPGAVIVYAIIGLLVWPKDENPDGVAVDGGLLRPIGAKIIWTVIWLEAAVLWMLHVDRSSQAISEQIKGMAGAAPHWLATTQNSVAKGLTGDGVTIATLLAILSVLLAVGVWTRARPAVLAAGAVLSLCYWVYGQSLGGPFWIGSATDVNTGPLLALLATTVFAIPMAAFRPARTRESAPTREVVGSAA